MLWIRNDKTGELYPNRAAAAKALGIIPKTVTKITHGYYNSTRYCLSIYDDGIDKIDAPNKNQLGRSLSKHTICETCDNYHCSWIQKFEPVEGWDAVEVPKNKSYIVRKCPEFKEIERKRK